VSIASAAMVAISGLSSILGCNEVHSTAPLGLGKLCNIETTLHAMHEQEATRPTTDRPSRYVPTTIEPKTPPFTSFIVSQYPSQDEMDGLWYVMLALCPPGTNRTTRYQYEQPSTDPFAGNMVIVGTSNSSCVRSLDTLLPMHLRESTPEVGKIYAVELPGKEPSLVITGDRVGIFWGSRAVAMHMTGRCNPDLNGTFAYAFQDAMGSSPVATSVFYPTGDAPATQGPQVLPK